MSGTSMDGIDISFVKTNGLELENLNKNYFYEYSRETRNFLLDILNKDFKFNLKRKEAVSLKTPPPFTFNLPQIKKQIYCYHKAYLYTPLPFL